MKTKAKCVSGQKPTWKDFRSGMACHLLKTGWSRDEINARLGHKPSSSEIDKYITLLAIDRTRSKERHHEANIEQVQKELHKFKLREKNHILRMERMAANFEREREERNRQMRDLQEQIDRSLDRDGLVNEFVRNLLRYGHKKAIADAFGDKRLMERLARL